MTNISKFSILGPKFKNYNRMVFKLINLSALKIVIKKLVITFFLLLLEFNIVDLFQLLYLLFFGTLKASLSYPRPLTVIYQCACGGYRSAAFRASLLVIAFPSPKHSQVAVCVVHPNTSVLSPLHCSFALFSRFWYYYIIFGIILFVLCNFL